MNTKFFSVSDNSFDNRGMPVTSYIVVGLVDQGPCPTCGVGRRTPTGDLQVRLCKGRARVWPDLLACGDYPCFVISERFLNAMQECGVRVVLGGRVDFVGPNQSILSLEDAPQYFWVDGEHCRAAKMDFDASGYVDVRFCPECGTRSENISLTHRRQHAGPPPGYVFEYDDSSGLDLFTTDLAPTAFFCTDRVLACARKHRLINLRFTPVEAGEASWSKGIDYLGKKWPPYHPLRRSEGKSLDEWLQQLRKPTKRYDARRALLDFGKEAAPAVATLTQMLDDEDVTLRREAALLLNAIGKLGVPLGAKGEEAARQHEEWFQKTLGR